jgi:hypothetical protein
MNKTNQLKTTTNLVKSILEENHQARNSDSYLYLKVLEHISAQKGIDLSGLTVPHFLTSLNVLGLPCFETVRRSRQKIQMECPELKGCRAVQDARAENEQAYREYARGSVC